MKLDRVKFNNGKAYTEYLIKSGRKKGQFSKHYGQIIICQNCEEECFAEDSDIKRGRGKFCSHKCEMQLENHPRWKGGRKKHGGYILIKKPDHPNKDKHGYIYEHRLIVEKQIGRYLHRWEIVHHIDKIRDNNIPQNLMGFKNESAHQRFESGKKVDLQNIIFDGHKM